MPMNVEYIYVNKTNITNIYNFINVSNKKISTTNNNTTVNNNINNKNSDNYIPNPAKNKTKAISSDIFHYNFNRLGLEKSNISEFNNLVINLINPVINNNNNVESKKNSIEDLFKNLKEEIINNTLKLRDLSKIENIFKNITNYNYNVSNNFYVKMEDKSINLRTNKLNIDQSNNLNNNNFNVKINKNNIGDLSVNERQKYHINQDHNQSKDISNNTNNNTSKNKVKKCKEDVIRINNTELIGKIINETFHDLKNDLNSQLNGVKNNLKRIVKQ